MAKYEETHGWCDCSFFCNKLSLQRKQELEKKKKSETFLTPCYMIVPDWSKCRLNPEFHRSEAEFDGKRMALALLNHPAFRNKKTRKDFLIGLYSSLEVGTSVQNLLEDKKAISRLTEELFALIGKEDKKDKVRKKR